MHTISKAQIQAAIEQLGREKKLKIKKVKRGDSQHEHVIISKQFLIDLLHNYGINCMTLSVMH